jgi:hypothetical protein
MKKDEKKQPNEGTEVDEPNEIQDPDFQFVLKQLLGVYQPILEEELERAKSPERLSSEAEANPPNCEEEFALAERIFGKFLTDEVVTRLLPKEGLQQLGAAADWRWCLSHIRCCIMRSPDSGHTGWQRSH